MRPLRYPTIDSIHLSNTKSRMMAPCFISKKWKLMVVFSLVQIIYGQPAGWPDSSFGHNGTLTTDINNSQDFSMDMCILPNQNMVVGGYCPRSWQQWKPFLVCYKANGELNTHFGNKGRVLLETGYSKAGIYALCAQKDGKIVAGGFSGNVVDTNRSDFTLMRFLPNGKLDPCFASKGIGRYPLGLPYSMITAVGVQNDGKIVSAGMVDQFDFPILAVTRHFSDGRMDTSFNPHAQYLYEVGVNCIASAIVFQPDGKILVTGRIHKKVSESNDIFVVRLKADGTYDSGFGNFGIVKIDLFKREDLPSKMELRPDGSILIAGTYMRKTYDFGIVCLDINGNLDTKFGVKGIVTIDIANGSEDWCRSMAIDINDGILLGGSVDSAGGIARCMALIRYDKNGKLDSSFGKKGIFTTPFDSFASHGVFVKIQNTHKIILGGYLRTMRDEDVVLWRIHSGIPFNEGIKTVQPNRFIVKGNPLACCSYLGMQLEKNEEITVELFDPIGRKVYEYLKNQLFEKGYTEIPLGNLQMLSTSSYFLVVKTRDNIYTQKVYWP